MSDKTNTVVLVCAQNPQTKNQVKKRNNEGDGRKRQVGLRRRKDRSALSGTCKEGLVTWPQASKGERETSVQSVQLVGVVMAMRIVFVEVVGWFAAVAVVGAVAKKWW